MDQVTHEGRALMTQSPPKGIRTASLDQISSVCIWRTHPNHCRVVHYHLGSSRNLSLVFCWCQPYQYFFLWRPILMSSVIISASVTFWGSRTIVWHIAHGATPFLRASETPCAEECGDWQVSDWRSLPRVSRWPMKCLCNGNTWCLLAWNLYSGSCRLSCLAPWHLV